MKKKMLFIYRRFCLIKSWFLIYICFLLNIICVNLYYNNKSITLAHELKILICCREKETRENLFLWYGKRIRENIKCWIFLETEKAIRHRERTPGECKSVLNKAKLFIVKIKKCLSFHLLSLLFHFFASSRFSGHNINQYKTGGFILYFIFSFFLLHKKKYLQIGNTKFRHFFHSFLQTHRFNKKNPRRFFVEFKKNLWNKKTCT